MQSEFVKALILALMNYTNHISVVSTFGLVEMSGFGSDLLLLFLFFF